MEKIISIHVDKESASDLGISEGYLQISSNLVFSAHIDNNYYNLNKTCHLSITTINTNSYSTSMHDFRCIKNMGKWMETLLNSGYNPVYVNMRYLTISEQRNSTINSILLYDVEEK